MTDAISELLFISEKNVEQDLLREGISRSKIYFVGNTMIDTLLKHKNLAEESSILFQLGLKRNEFAVLTIHRPSNVDNPMLLKEICNALNEIAMKIKIVFPMHPRTSKGIEKEGIFLNKNIVICEAMGYLDFLKLTSNARFVLTDSGGIQEETTVLGAPRLTIRENTERPVTVAEETNTLVGIHKERIIGESLKILSRIVREYSLPEGWDGKAAERVVDVIKKLYSQKL